MMLAMAITVSNVMAKRIEESSSTPSRSTRCWVFRCSPEVEGVDMCGKA